MKYLIFLFSVLVAANSYTQTLVEFKLQRNGYFVAPDGKPYIVVEYDGKTVQELYSLVKSNVMTLYKSPQNIMSENYPKEISIQALSNILEESYKFGEGFVSYRAYYNYIFHFKDGKIKIDAPLIDPNLYVTSTGATYSKTFESLIKGWFDKNGEIKKKKLNNVRKIENTFNLPINYLLGSSNDEDW